MYRTICGLLAASLCFTLTAGSPASAASPAAEQNHAFAACADGKAESPIDIVLSKVKINNVIDAVNVNYKPADFAMTNNGYTIQLNDRSGSNSIVIDGSEYKLIQMHFHKPSEHRLDGHSFAMEGHLVHANRAGQLAVLGFLIKEGDANKVLARAWSKLPKQVTTAEIPLEKPVDLARLFPKKNRAFRYRGTLTSPPCSEHATWVIFEQAVQMSKEQIAAFGAIFPENQRPVQPLRNRPIIEDVVTGGRGQ